MIAFVPEEAAQRRPSGIEHALRHPGPRHRRGRYVAERDLAGAIHQRPGEFVESILSPAGYLGVDGPNLPLALPALRLGQLRFEVAVEPGLFEFLAVRALGDGLEPEVDANVIAPAALQARHLDRPPRGGPRSKLVQGQASSPARWWSISALSARSARAFLNSSSRHRPRRLSSDRLRPGTGPGSRQGCRVLYVVPSGISFRSTMAAPTRNS